MSGKDPPPVFGPLDVISEWDTMQPAAYPLKNAERRYQMSQTCVHLLRALFPDKYFLQRQLDTLDSQVTAERNGAEPGPIPVWDMLSCRYTEQALFTHDPTRVKLPREKNNSRHRKRRDLFPRPDQLERMRSKWFRTRFSPSTLLSPADDSETIRRETEKVKGAIQEVSTFERVVPDPTFVVGNDVRRSTTVRGPNQKMVYVFLKMEPRGGYLPSHKRDTIVQVWGGDEGRQVLAAMDRNDRHRPTAIFHGDPFGLHDDPSSKRQNKGHVRWIAYLVRHGQDDPNLPKWFVVVRLKGYDTHIEGIDVETDYTSEYGAGWGTLGMALTMRALVDRPTTFVTVMQALPAGSLHLENIGGIAGCIAYSRAAATLSYRSYAYVTEPRKTQALLDKENKQALDALEAADNDAPPHVGQRRSTRQHPAAGVAVGGGGSSSGWDDIKDNPDEVDNPDILDFDRPLDVLSLVPIHTDTCKSAKIGTGERSHAVYEMIFVPSWLPVSSWNARQPPLVVNSSHKRRIAIRDFLNELIYKVRSHTSNIPWFQWNIVDAIDMTLLVLQYKGVDHPERFGRYVHPSPLLYPLEEPARMSAEWDPHALARRNNLFCKVVTLEGVGPRSKTWGVAAVLAGRIFKDSIVVLETWDTSRELWNDERAKETLLRLLDMCQIVLVPRAHSPFVTLVPTHALPSPPTIDTDKEWIEYAFDTLMEQRYPPLLDTAVAAQRDQRWAIFVSKVFFA